MKKRFINGTILRVEDYITSVNFESHEMDSEKYSSIRTYRYINENKIDVKYNIGATISKLPKIMFEQVAEEDIELTYSGKCIPQYTVIINGVEYIMSDNIYDTINIYLIHNLPELGVTESRLGVYNNSLYIALLDTDYKDWTITDYISFINESGLIFCHSVDPSKFNISNVYSAYFDNKIYEYKDFGIIGLQREFYVNDVTVAADFVRQMRQRYPEIQFYTRNEDKNTTKYNEWINYKILPSPIKHSTLFTSHVRYSKESGNYWKSALDVEFEYESNDLPTLLTRRDQYRSGGFFNNDCQFSYIIDDGEGNKDFDVGYTVFWDRDSQETEYGKSTSQDDNGYAQFTYKYSGKLGYINIEDRYTTKQFYLVESVIYTVLYAPKNVDLNKYDDGIYLRDTDLDFKEFLKVYNNLKLEFEAKFGIRIEYNPTTMEIEEYRDFESGRSEIESEFNKWINELKSIKDSAIKKSNYVMVASLKQVQKLVESYKEHILEQIKDRNWEFGIDEGNVIGDDEYTMLVDSINPDFNVSDEDIKDDQDNADEDNSTDKNEDEDDNVDIDINEHYHDEHVINADGEYHQSDELNNKNDSLIL